MVGELIDCMCAFEEYAPPVEGEIPVADGELPETEAAVIGIFVPARAEDDFQAVEERIVQIPQAVLGNPKTQGVRRFAGAQASRASTAALRIPAPIPPSAPTQALPLRHQRALSSAISSATSPVWGSGRTKTDSMVCSGLNSSATDSGMPPSL